MYEYGHLGRWYIQSSLYKDLADPFNGKKNEVNDYLSKLCMERNIYLIDHSKTKHRVQIFIKNF